LFFPNQYSERLWKSRVIRRRAEIGFKQWFAGRRGERTIRGFKSYKNRVDFLQGLRIIELHGPAMLGLIVIVENSKIPGHLTAQIVTVAAPRRVDELALSCILRGEVERVKNQRFAFCVEGAPEGFSDASFA